MEEIRKALKERERQSLTLTAIVGVSICVFYALLSAQLPIRDVTPLFGALIMAPVALTLVVALVFLRRNRGVTAIGYLMVGVLAGMFFIYPHILLATLGPAEASPAVILKSAQIMFGAIIIAFMSLTLKPALAIASAVAIFALHGINIWIVLADPRTIVTDSTYMGLLGPGLLRSRIYIDWALLAFAGTIAVAVTIAARKTVWRAVGLERIDGRLRRYFSPDVVEQLAQSGEWPVETRGVMRDVAVLFSDIEGFTEMVRDLPPDAAVAILAEYRERMVTEIFRQRGTLDKFIGDGMLAVFGTFGKTGNAADRALAAATAMNVALDDINGRRLRDNLPALRHRIGLHAGPALVGNVVAAGQMEFTVIGDTVNMANRIEQAGKKLGQYLLLSDAFCSQLQDMTLCQSLGPVLLPGYKDAIEVFTMRQASLVIPIALPEAANA